MTPLAIILGAFFNRLRGGMFPKLPFSKVIYDFAFALFFTMVLDPSNKLLFLSLFIASMAGRSLGWGAYIGNMIVKIDNGEEEIKFIDKIIRDFKFPYHKPVIRNTAALSLRGLLWTMPIAIAFWFNDFPASFWIGSIGLLMGPVYLAVIEACGTLLKDRHSGWKYSEYVWGAVLWGLITIAI